MIKEFAVQGATYYSESFDEIKYIKDCLICVDKEGIIEKVLQVGDTSYESVLRSYENSGQLRQLRENELLLPGFIDLHIHGPQWAQSGTALDRPLEVWLNEYTFPLEAQFKDMDFAKNVYSDVVKTSLKNGTTSAMYFATVDQEPSLLLAKICGQMGQRGYVGKVAMDDPRGCPSYYMDKNDKEAIERTESFIKDVLAIQDDYKQKVYPVITPRFIPTCTEDCLKGLGKLAKQYPIHVQTHASESDWAHQYVKEKVGKNDVLALDDYGILGPKTILAHTPFLEESDIKRMVERKSTIAHCPLSNAYFANSVLPVKAFYERGINIGLATDISGGYSPSMYQAIRQAVLSSKMLNDGVNPALNKEKRGRKGAALTLNNAFYMATVAGGRALGLPLGKLEKGYIFDAQLVNTQENIPRFYKEKHEEDLLHKVVLLAQTTNIKEVWVQGERVI